MNTNRRHAVAALVAAGLLWGTTVPLSKLALEWLPPGWLAFARFGLAAAILLTAASRPAVRGACTPLMLASGAAGYGGSVVVQNAGITRTSVTHAALLIGAAPVLVAVIAALWQHTVARPVAWAGFALSLAGVGLVTGGQGGAAVLGGHGGLACRPARPGHGPGHRRPGGRGHAAAVHALRLRAEPDTGRGGRRLPQPRAARRRRGGHRRVR